MMQQPKVLVISRDSWNDTNNSGNTLSNLFQNWDSNNIATIYCRDEIPNNKICTNYFKISESLLVKKFLGKTKVAGQRIQNPILQTNSTAAKDEQNEKKLYNFFRKNRLHIFLWGREILWKLVNWKTKELKGFIDDFKPDIIYSPSYDSFYMHDILKFVKNYSGVKVIYFHCDDLVTYRQYSLSPLFWINRFLLRQYMNHSIKMASKNYCIIDEQSKVYNEIYNLDFDVLYKTGDFLKIPNSHVSNSTLKLVYTGNIIYGRIKTLITLAETLQMINSNKMKARLYIYTANEIIESDRDKLLKTNSVEIVGKIPYSQISSALAEGDILVHVESFERQQMFGTSLSFSTKIVDYLEAGKPIFGIGWEKAASIRYIHDNLLGVTANNYNIKTKLLELIETKNNLMAIGKKAWEFGKLNHNTEIVLNKFQNELKKLSVK